MAQNVQVEEIVDEVMNDPWLIPFWDQNVSAEEKKTALRSKLTTLITEAEARGRKMAHTYTAWCPECFDGMEATNVKNEAGLTVAHQYHCFGCDKWFSLQALTNHTV